jgi:hypothetical protein
MEPPTSLLAMPGTWIQMPNETRDRMEGYRLKWIRHSRDISWRGPGLSDDVSRSPFFKDQIPGSKEPGPGRGNGKRDSRHPNSPPLADTIAKTPALIFFIMFPLCSNAEMATFVQASQEMPYSASFCFGLEPIPNSMSHSLILAPITSGWSSCR